MFVTFLIIIVIISIILLYKLVNYLKLDYISVLNKTITIGGYCAILFTLINVLFFLYTVYSFKNKLNPFGSRGPIGFTGPRGKDGVCTSRCGQTACLSIILENIDNYLLSNPEYKIEGNNMKLNNTFLKQHIKNICFSDKYHGFISTKQKSKKSPTEKVLIDYIYSIVEKWVTHIIQFDQKKGKDFLYSLDKDESFYGIDPKSSPFTEIKKYEIWSWGNPYTFKPIIRQQCSSHKRLLNTKYTDLDIIYSNNYDTIYINKEIETVLGPTSCKFNQLNIKKKTNCYYPINGKTFVSKIWDEEKYETFDQDIGFYNLQVIINGEETYYPVGTVWTGSWRNKPTPTPSKLSILVSSKNTVATDGFDQIWSTKERRTDNETLIPDDDGFTIWRPKCPDKYISLGDYVSKSKNGYQHWTEPRKDVIRCIKKDHASDMKHTLKGSVWSKNGFLKKKTPGIMQCVDKSVNDCKESEKIEVQGEEISEPFKYIKPVSIWPILISNEADRISEIDGRAETKSVNDLDIGGYNLFRATTSEAQKPGSGERDDGIWVINPGITVNIAKTDNKNNPTNDIGIEWLPGISGQPRQNKYSSYTPRGYTEHGFIINKDHISYNEKTKLHTLNKNAPRGYYLNIHNSDKKTYSILKYNNTNNAWTDFITINNNTIEQSTEEQDIPKNPWTFDAIDQDEFNNSKKKYIVIKSTQLDKFLYETNETNLELHPSKKTTWLLIPSTGIKLK